MTPFPATHPTGPPLHPTAPHRTLRTPQSSFPLPLPVQELVSGDREPITPFITKLPALAASGVSCVLVIGGSGQYFDVAGVWRIV